jgi:hypothetical protein
MTKAAQDYFKAYYKLQRIIDENIQDPQMEECLRLELKKAYDNMTDRERELLDIVGKDNIKE